MFQVSLNLFRKWFGILGKCTYREFRSVLSLLQNIPLCAEGGNEQA